MDECQEESLPEGLIKFRGVCLRAPYKEYADVIENFRVRDDDVWIIGFPKSGTTWTREMVWCVGNDLNFESAKMNLDERCPFLESAAMVRWDELSKKYPGLNVPEYMTNSITLADKLPSPRFIKTHLPVHLLPRDLRERKTRAKIVYVTRDPKDAAISLFNFRRNAYGDEVTLEESCRRFFKGHFNYFPFWDHVLGYLQAKDDFGDRMLILKFADMKANIRTVIEEVSKFLGKPSLSSDDLEKLVQHLSLEKMKKNSAVNWEEWMEIQNLWNRHKREGQFIRSGQVGEWKSVMPQEISEEFDERTSSALKLTDFTF